MDSLALAKATSWKISQYQQILSQATQNADTPFWDVVVVTAGDEEQRLCYEKQIDIKLQRKEIPTFVKYLVIADLPGAKIGNGGATMHAFEQLEQTLGGWEKLEKAKVMMIHAGGYSQRLPSVSVVGKVFMALPCGDPMMHMFDALLMMYCDLPPRMKAGIFLTSSDVIFLYDGSGEWDMKQPGISAIAHPSSLKTATSHGVFVLEDVGDIRSKYEEDHSKPSSMGKVRQFLHKVSIEKMKATGAIIPGTEQVYVDLAYTFDIPTAKKITKFYSSIKPLCCEIDAYGDFLQALGPDASSEYCNNTANVTTVTEDLVRVRQQVYEMMKDTQLTAVIFNQAQFNHVGTTSEYLDHLCYNRTLINSLQIVPEVMVGDMGNQESESDTTLPESKKIKVSHFTECAIMHSVLHDRASVLVGAGTVMEYCTLEKNVTVGKNCIVSNLYVPEDSTIPDGSFLHTVPVSVGEETCFATFAFDVKDNMKASVPIERAGELKYCELNMATAIQLLCGESKTAAELWQSDNGTVCSLWSARLFPVFKTRRESADHAIWLIKCLKENKSCSVPSAGHDGQCLSQSDMLRQKSISLLLRYHDDLRTKILQNSK